MGLIINLWGSWLVIYIATRFLTGFGMSALIILLANGRRTLPMTKRKIQALVYGSIVVSAALTWFLADVWFSFIEFQPVWIGVVGSLGLLALSLWDRYRKNREQLATLRKKLPK